MIKTKKLRKRSSCLILSSILIMVVSSSQVKADDPMSQAQAAVRASYLQAEGVAAQAVAEDFNFAMSDVLKSLVNPEDVSNLANSLVTEQESIYNQLVDISKLDENVISKLQGQAAATYERYKKVVRDRFDNSFGYAEARASRRASLQLVASTLRQFQSNCLTGKGQGGIGGVAFEYPDLPKADWSVQVGSTNGEISSIGGSYSGSGSDAEKKRNEFSNFVSVGASKIATTAYLAEGAAAEMCAVAAPWAIGGAVAVAVVVAYINEQERIEKENEIVEAKTYAFDKMATDRDVGQFYREQCKEVSHALNPVIEVFESAIEDPSRLLRYGNSDFDMAKFQQLVKRRDEIRKQISGFDSTSGNEASLRNLVKEVENIEHQIAEHSQPERVAIMAAQVLLNQDDSFASQFREFTQQKLDLAQEAAFRKILRILRLAQNRNFAKYLNENDPIERELLALREYMDGRKLFKQVVVAQVRFIFGREEKAQVELLEQRLITVARSLMSQYGQNREIFNFTREVRNLVGHL